MAHASGPTCITQSPQPGMRARRRGNFLHLHLLYLQKGEFSMAMITIPISPETEDDLKSFIKKTVTEAMQEQDRQSAQKEYLTTKEVKDLLGISYGTLRAWQTKGLPVFELESKRLYRRSAIEQFIRDNEK